MSFAEHLLAFFVGIGVRMLMALAHASPTLLCGLLVAVVFRVLVGGRALRDILAAGTTGSLARAWLLGMLLPVCSIGAILVARELRRIGISAGAVLAFAVSAPLFNPISLLYGLTLSHPLVILGFAGASMVVVMLTGMVHDRLWTRDAVDPPPEPQTPPGWRRLAVMALAGCREATGPTLGLTAIAIAGVGLLTAMLPFGILQRSAKAFDPWAPPLMTAIGLPAYLTPTDVMMQVGSMFDHGNSVGAAYVLLSVGAGLNLGLVAWAYRSWGWRPATAWLGVLVGLVLTVAFVIERPLSFRDTPPEDHTHAFDTFCMPFPLDGARPVEQGGALLTDRVPAHEWTSLALLAAVLLTGLVIRRLDPTSTWETRLSDPATDSSQSPQGFDVVVPPRILGGLSVAGLILLSMAAAYLYYPPPQTCLEDLQFAEAEVHAAALAGDQRRTEVWIVALEDLIRRGEVGLWIRGLPVTSDVAAAAVAFRERVEAVEHAVLEHDHVDPELVRGELKSFISAGRVFRDCLREAGLPEPPSVRDMSPPKASAAAEDTTSVARE